MRFTRKLFRTIVLLLVVLYAGAHLCIRIGFVQRRVLESFSERAGYTVEASKVRFTGGLAWTLRDVRLSYVEQGATNTVFEAPVVTLRTRRGGFVRVPRGASFFARRSTGPTGVWTPSQAQTFGRGCCAVEAFRQAGLLFGTFSFDVADASIFVTDEDGRQTVFAGVNWSRLPADLPGFPAAVAASLAYQRASGLAVAAPESLPVTRWLEFGGKVIDLSDRPAPPPPAPSAGVIGGEDGPTSLWLSSKAKPEDLPPKEDMVEAFREFFRTDPETAKAFFEAADEARGEKETPEAAPVAPAPVPAEKHEESAAGVEPAPASAPVPEKKDAESAEGAAPAPAPAPAEKHAESAESAEPAPASAPAPEKKHAERAEGSAPSPAPSPAAN